MIVPGPGQRHSIEQIWPSVAGALGVEGFDNPLGLPPARRYVLVLVDGLGETLLREHAELAPFLSSQPSVPDLVCGVPSTTATSLTSLGTGRRAGEHGVVGYTARVPETGARINSLTWDQDVDPLRWQPYGTILECMGAAGVAVGTVNDARFEGSALTLCSQRGIPFHGVKSVWERLDVVLDVVETADRAAVYAYESRLDHTGHAHGCTSQEWRDMLVTVDRELAELRAELPADTTLVVTADHGMIDLPAEGRFDVDAHPRLLDDVDLLAGEARFRHVYTRQPEAVAERWRAELGDRVLVRRREDAGDWFGPVRPEVSGRIGDVVVAALDDFAVFSSREFALEMMMAGFHGSVTEAELRIPLVVATG
ncbi:type I phosphodiesterase / nucleotide pyrophosphatase [Aeromicrobium marinum DSM 15272]|uniref:Type I phosphodiesterase / nucleotide pyrophosphatase n=1 Tax=Aeromicrobium marinum DSM 15272 TaxID=585531 RepID=E2SAC1_9ACTN|nr:nucleotide pyrophosphatase/phosphodiesterase family protein [Aeromicrobium marinum]EFQ84195.1 type I phosphodiesterase / nucleotide pyrophosphatase [Aeromicrobium marinum DSM 15272]